MPFVEYFNQRSHRFSRLYEHPLRARLLGRGALFVRLELAVAWSVMLGASRVLDIGCGSGPLLGRLAARGVHVTGIDPSERMVAAAKRVAASCGASAKVLQLGWEQIPEWHTGEPFDVAVALGVFDYEANSGDLLSMMGDIASYSIASFPSVGLRTSLRKLRYGIRGVQVRGASTQDINRLVNHCGMETVRLAPLGRAGHILLSSNKPGVARLNHSVTG